MRPAVIPCRGLPGPSAVPDRKTWLASCRSRDTVGSQDPERSRRISARACRPNCSSPRRDRVRSSRRRGIPNPPTTRRRRTRQGVRTSERVGKRIPESGCAHIVAAQHELESVVGASFQARKHLHPRFGCWHADDVCNAVVVCLEEVPLDARALIVIDAVPLGPAVDE